MVKNLPSNAGDTGNEGLNPGLGRSPGEGNGNPLQYYCLENPMDRGALLATVFGVTKSGTQLSDFTFTFNNALSVKTSIENVDMIPVSLLD